MDWRPNHRMRYDTSDMPPLVDSRGPIPPPGRGEFPSVDSQFGGIPRGGSAFGGGHAFPGVGGGGGGGWPPPPPQGIGGFQPPMQPAWGGSMPPTPYSLDDSPPYDGYPGFGGGGGGMRHDPRMQDPRMMYDQHQPPYALHPGGQGGHMPGYSESPESDDSWEEQNRPNRRYPNSPYPDRGRGDPYTPSMDGSPLYEPSAYDHRRSSSAYDHRRPAQAYDRPPSAYPPTDYGTTAYAGSAVDRTAAPSRMSDWTMVSYPQAGYPPSATMHPQDTPYGPGAMIKSGSMGGGYTGRPNRRPSDWRPDFKKSGFGNFLGRRRSFPGLEGPRGVLHRYLEYNRGDPPAFLDLRLPYNNLDIPELGRPLSREDFGRFVMEPPPPHLRLVNSKLPWYIEIIASTTAGVTFLDFFSQLCTFLHQPIVQHDYYNSLLDDGDRDRIGRAWFERANGNQEDLAAGVRRIDFLMGRVMFQGLDRNRDGFWELKTARPETQPNRRMIRY